jgi:peptidoglycan/LPS O-acetylase OafA/YrhL
VAPGAIGNAIDRLFYTGWAGVDLFFVLSGFLISSILLSTRNDERYFARFYTRRALRIFPVHYVALALGFFVLPYLAPAYAPRLLQDAAHGQVWFWTYTSNIALATGVLADGGVFGHFWTLAIEEQYYFVWPTVVRFCSRRTLIVVALAMIAAALFVRVAALALGLGWAWAYRATPARIDGFGVGAVIAALMLDERASRRLFRLAPYGAAATGAVLAFEFWRVPRFYPSNPSVITWDHSLLAIMSGWLIILGLGHSSPSWMRSRWLRWFGTYSYGIYVWHWPLQRVLTIVQSGPMASDVMFGSGIAILVIGVVGSCALGWISYIVIERPFLRLKDRFAYQSRPYPLEQSS